MLPSSQHGFSSNGQKDSSYVHALSQLGKGSSSFNKSGKSSELSNGHQFKWDQFPAQFHQSENPKQGEEMPSSPKFMPLQARKKNKNSQNISNAKPDVNNLLSMNRRNAN